MATLRLTDADRGPDGKILTLDQLLLSSRAAIATPQAERDDLADSLPAVAAPADQTIQRRALTRIDLATIAALGLLLVGLLAYLWGSAPANPAAPPRAPATAQTRGDSIAAPSPLPATAPAVAGRLLIAFAAPDGQPLGAIEATRAITPTAHYGAGWIQANVSGSGLVWLRAADAPELAIVGPDLSPRPTLAPAAAPAQPAATDPPPTAPTQCATAGIVGKMVSSCGYDDLSVLQEQAKAKWIAAYGGNVGTVTTPTPYGGTP